MINSCLLPRGKSSGKPKRKIGTQEPVIFRRWGNGDVIALFPEIQTEGHYIQSYEHIGQHSSADYQCVLRQTKPAKSSSPDVKDLIQELRNRDYDLKIVTRRPR